MKNRRTGIMALSVVVLGFAGLLGASAYWRFQEGAPGQGSKPGSLDIDGRTRTYFLHVPPVYDGKKSLPLVLVLHGTLETAAATRWRTRWTTWPSSAR